MTQLDRSCARKWVRTTLKVPVVPPSLKANLPVTLNRSFTHVVGVLIGDTVPVMNVPVRVRRL